MTPLARPTRDEWPRLRPRTPSWEDLRSSLWFWPAVVSVLAFVLAAVLTEVRPLAGTRWAWPGDRDSASAFLQVAAGSVITVTSLTFSLVVVALQLASQQFSPRLLREFARDTLTQVVLGTLVATFVVALTVLRSLDGDELPSLALLLAYTLTLLSVAALLGFIGHIARLVRIDTMMAAVHRQTRRTVDEHYAEYGEPVPTSLVADAPEVIPSADSGFVQQVRVDELVAAAARCDAVVLLSVRPGDHVGRGTPVARARVALDRRDELVAAVHAALEVGYERTQEQDAALGLRQLTDIAVKALSPGINDPTTAAHAIGHAGDLVMRLQGRRLGPVVHAGDDGRPRVLVPDRDHRYYLDLVVGPVRRYGAHEPTILVALLRMLRDAAVAARDDAQRAEIRRQARLVVATTADGLLPDDVDTVRDAERRVHQALDGDVACAYEDRAGETRSL